MELFITFAILIFVVAFSMIRFKFEERKNRDRYIKKLKEQYGKFPDYNYSLEELESIPRLFEHEKDNYECYLDDITWNDLDMDHIYQLINHTQSSSGAEYLYETLRVIRLSADNMPFDEGEILFFMEHEKERIDVQLALHELGKTGKYSLFDYLDYMDTIGQKSNKKHLFFLIALLLSIAAIFVKTEVGVVIFLIVSCYQIVTYLSEKKKLLPYLSSFQYIVRMIESADKILNICVDSRIASIDDMKQQVTSLQAMKKGYSVLMRMNSSTGNPIELLVEYIKMITHLDLIQFNRTLNHVINRRTGIIELSKSLGHVDTVISIGAFRKSLPFYCKPVLSCEEKDFAITNGYHPAIKDAVVNSFRQNRGMILTGSNASGKSTFLKMTAINVILAQTIQTCCAEQYVGNYYRIYSSMSLRDSLENGESYYIVEIKALKRIMDVALEKSSQDNPLLCFVDEVLRGTNTVERIAASTKILEELSNQKVICFAATHDIELTHLLQECYDNYHFEEEVKDGDVLFSYRLLNGRAISRNAIRLLQIIGFDDDVIEQAEQMAARFLDTGEWEA